mgnify:CR=1 FL=1
MSFRSGFAQGTQIAAQLQNKASRERASDLQEARDKINSEAQKQLIDQRQAEFERKRDVNRRTEEDRLTSETALGYYASEAGKLKFNDREDVTKFRELTAYTMSEMKDPNVLKKFGMIMDMHQQKYAYKKQIDRTIRAEELSTEYEDLADEMHKETGVTLSPSDPESRSRLDAWGRKKKMDAHLMKLGVTYEDAGVDGSQEGLSASQFATMNNYLLESGKQQRIYNDKTDEQKNAETVKKRVDALPENASLREKMETTRGSNPLKQSETEAIDQAFVAIDLVTSSERQMENLGIPLQGNEFGNWFASLKEFSAPFTGQDVSNIKAFRSTVTQLVPVLAKGVFRETGVLTDEDIRRYSATIASIENTPNANERVMAATQSLIARITRNQLRRSVSGGKDVSAYVEDAAKLSNMPKAAYWPPTDLSGRDLEIFYLKELYRDLVMDETIYPGEKFRYRSEGKWQTAEVPQKSFF